AKRIFGGGGRSPLYLLDEGECKREDREEGLRSYTKSSRCHYLVSAFAPDTIKLLPNLHAVKARFVDRWTTPYAKRKRSSRRSTTSAPSAIDSPSSSSAAAPWRTPPP